MKIGLCLMLSVLALALAACQSESGRPEADSAAAPSITMNAAEPAVTQPEAAPSDTAAAENQAAAQEPSPAPAAGGPSGLTKDFLMHQKFVLVQVNEADYSPAGQDLPIPSLEFGEDFRVSGRICNNYHGQGELQDDVLSVQAMASTRMLCPNTNLSQLETKFFDMLENGAALSMDGDRLSLKQGDSSLVFKAQTGS